MEVEKGILLDGGVRWGIARAHCLSDMLVQVVVGSVLRSLLSCTLLVYERSCIFYFTYTEVMSYK